MKKKHAIFLAILAAALYAINIPLSKLLLVHLSETMMAGLLYLGAGIGLSFVGLFDKCRKKKSDEQSLTTNDIPYTFGMVVLDIAAPILLMFGIARAAAENVSLLGNFEIVATALIAALVFKEKISGRLWISILFIVSSCALLSVNSSQSLSFSKGSFYVLLAAVCWGLENNCTRKISDKNPMQIVIIKGFGSGIGSLLIAWYLHSLSFDLLYGGLTLLLGFVSYGLSIYFYVYAQRFLGAAKTSAFYAVSPFIGVVFSFLIFNDIPGLTFYPALVLMIIGSYLATTENRELKAHAQKSVAESPHD